MRKWILPLLISLMLAGAVTYAQQSGGPGGTTFNGGTITTPLVAAAGTITTSNPGVQITQTWNAGGITFNSLLINVTNTASAAASSLFDFQVASASQLKLTVNGANPQLTVANSGCGTPPYSFIGNTTTGLCSTSAAMLTFQVGGAAIGNTFNGTNNGFGNRSDNVIAWSSSSTLPSGTQGVTEDTGISRLAAASLVIGNGTQGDASGTLKAANLNAGTVFQINGVNGATHAACSTSVTAITVTGGIITAITCT